VVLTDKEKIYLKAIPLSDYNDGDQWKDGGGVWCFSVTDQITEYTPQQAKGVMSSLVKKGLINIMDYEGGGRPEDMCVGLTLEGVQALKNLLEELETN